MKRVKLIEKTINELKKQIPKADTEIAHSNADRILCNFLFAIGYEEIVETYQKVPKWYV